MNILFLLAVFLLFTHSGKRVYAKDFDCMEMDKSPSENTSSVNGIPDHTYVGIPIGSWKITDLNSTERDDLCTRQQNFCADECGGQYLVTKNFCDRSRMSWMCTCQNHIPDTPPYRWPITLAECQGRENSCENGCTSSGSSKDICVRACNRYYKCNQAGSPASGLKVEREDQVPRYELVFGSSSSSSLSSFSFFLQNNLSTNLILLTIIVFTLSHTN